MKISVTGHRPNKLFEFKCDEAITGMALGINSKMINQTILVGFTLSARTIIPYESRIKCTATPSLTSYVTAGVAERFSK